MITRALTRLAVTTFDLGLILSHLGHVFPALGDDCICFQSCIVCIILCYLSSADIFFNALDAGCSIPKSTPSSITRICVDSYRLFLGLELVDLLAACYIISHLRTCVLLM